MKLEKICCEKHDTANNKANKLSPSLACKGDQERGESKQGGKD